MMALVAKVVAMRSPCKRLQVGAVITNLEFSTIYSMGYNGPERRGPNACRYDGAGTCGCVHAEMNALIKAPYDRGDLLMVTTHSPCELCAQLIVNSRVNQVMYIEQYRSDTGLLLLHSRGVIVGQVALAHWAESLDPAMDPHNLDWSMTRR